MQFTLVRPIQVNHVTSKAAVMDETNTRDLLIQKTDALPSLGIQD